MTEQPVTLEALAESLLQDLLDNIVRHQTLASVSRHRSLQETVGSKDPLQVPTYNVSSTKDIYGQDKLKLKSSEGSRYFQCENCGRKIAGGRFAQHINKCLDRKGR
ncbi:SAGA-associated factor 11 [[Candida] anglica]|uniref:SAGA-associated factor 11 n=1 Tax=[Candida] anglica TaxID=148631 RepID=A0ABP0ELI4_9ASCO